jgi:hypothetical protein
MTTLPVRAESGVSQFNGVGPAHHQATVECGQAGLLWVGHRDFLVGGGALVSSMLAVHDEDAHATAAHAW